MIPTPFFSLIDAVLGLYQMVIFIWVIMSWLLSFNVINAHNQVVGMIWQTLSALIEPALRPIRNLLPRTGSIDLSPIVLIFAIFFLREMNRWLAVRIGV